MKRAMPLPLTGVLLAVTWSASAQAGIIFNVTFEDVVNTTGVGFDHGTLGESRRNTFNAALTYIDTVLDHSGTADIVVEDSQTDGSGFLAAAGPYLSTTPNGFQNGYMFEHVTTGTDPSAGSPDASVTFDFGYTWNSETDAPGGSEFDLMTVSLHEVTHSLGFLSLVGADGKSRLTSSDPGVFSVYDSFLENGDGTALFGAGGDYLGTTADLTSGDVWFDGPNATAANGGTPVKIYAPGTFATGSSISHVDHAQISTAVMQYAIGPGTQRRTYTAPELGILNDIGYTLSSQDTIPEPTTLAIWLLAIAAVPSVRQWRRRRRERKEADSRKCCSNAP